MLPPDPDDLVFKPARDAMIADQLLARGIRSARVLHAMAAVPRHRFVAPSRRHESYEDSALPSTDGQTISQPYIVALMTELLDIHPDHSVLELGTGTGYQTAILALLAKEVCTIERIGALAASARERLDALGLANIHYATADGSLGWVDPQIPAPRFDRILVTAAAQEAPPPLLRQLANSGRLVIPLGDANSQTLTTITRLGNTFERHQNIPCRFVPLIGAHAWPNPHVPP